MAGETTDDMRDVSTLWAGSHVVIAILILGVSMVQSVRIALYVAVLVFAAMAFEYAFGPAKVVMVRRGR